MDGFVLQLYRKLLHGLYIYIYIKLHLLPNQKRLRSWPINVSHLKDFVDMAIQHSSTIEMPHKINSVELAIKYSNYCYHR